MKTIKTIFLAIAAAGVLAAQPRIDSVLNNYSYVLPNSPNYGIAQGSIFTVFGANLANSATGLQSVPLNTTLNGVSVQVTVSGTTTNVILYYVTPSQLAGILPSATPVGTGTIRVNNNGQQSNAAAIVVVRSAFGTLTLDGTGSGAAAVYDVNFQFLSATNSTKPGDVIQMFGTGVGPVTGAENLQQVQENLTNIAMTARVGGVNATVLYRGRTIFPGLDQINIQIPTLAQYGCQITVEIITGNISSNTTTIPVAQNGGTCPPPPTGGGGGGDGPLTQTEIDGYISAGVARFGSFYLNRDVGYTTEDSLTGGQPTTRMTRTTSLSASFSRFSGDLRTFFNSAANQFVTLTVGQCAVMSITNANPFPGVTITSLDAGDPLRALGPNGTRDLPRRISQNGVSYFTEVDAAFASPGQYTFSGPGGPNVGAFSGNVTVGAELEWTNRAQITAVTRSSGQTVTWSGGDPNSLVYISGSSAALVNGSPSGAFFTCYARNSDRSFTVPSSILLQLPASSRVSAGPITLVQRGSLSIGTNAAGTRVQASGLDYMVLSWESSTSQDQEYR